MLAISFAFLGVLIYSKKPARFIVADVKSLLPNTKTIAQPATKVVSINAETVTAVKVEQN